jgi:hypothetical protein
MTEHFNEDYCLFINGESDGYSYHHTTVVEMVNDGFKLEENEEFVQMSEMTRDQTESFKENYK